ncbi:MAG TPA: sigma factor-like helix-turn-helix DNA-binding protein [Acidimicrobiia bacterium]|nr:sigma factor-like helix-turn-helix DNA-binding protein [Acidimicrobiia bacterium]
MFGEPMSDGDSSSYSTFHRRAEPRLRVALVAAFGADRGREAALEALVYGWEHWERVREMENPIGYLYRVAQRRARRGQRRAWVLFPPPVSSGDPWVEPGLPNALKDLSPAQRQAVVLVYAYGYPHREVAEMLGVAPSTVQQHCDRGLRKLRSALGVTADA